MKAFFSLLGPGRIAALLVCAVLAALAYVLKFVFWGYSFSALVCLCLIAVILFYTFMPLVGLKFPAFAAIATRCFTALLCIGLLVVGITECCILKASFGDPKETADYIESIRLKVNQCGTVESMEYLSRAGRVKASKAFFGNLFGVKPIIISDRKGQNYAYKKVKGTANARVAIADHIVNAANGVFDTLLISHADCLDDAILLRDEILKKAPFKEVILGYIGPIVGASVGPGTVICFTFGEEVTVEGNE